MVSLPNRTSDEKKEKGGEKTPENGEHEKHPKPAHLEINRGTAVWTDQCKLVYDTFITQGCRHYISY